MKSEESGKEESKGSCEFHIGHNENQTNFQIVVCSSCPMDTKLLLHALSLFIEDAVRDKVNLFNMDGEFILHEN